MSDILSGAQSFATPNPIGAAVNGPTTEANADAAALASDFDDFLTLLTAQLQNQDPLEPQDSAEFTNQLVQFSQVEQQIKSNEQLESLVGLQNSSLTSVALGYIGMNIEVPGTDFNHVEGQPYQFSYTLPAAGASDVSYTIVDSAGQPVYVGRGSISGGKNPVVWDGTDGAGNNVPAGNYRIALQAVDGEGEIIEDATTNVTVLVDGIETANGQITLTAGNELIPLQNILSASTPPTATQIANNGS